LNVVATQAQLMSLIRSYAEGDQARFYSVALELAGDAAKRGNRAVAEEIRALIQDSRKPRGPFDVGSEPIPVVRPRGELAGIVSAKYPVTRLNDMVLNAPILLQLRRLIEEQRHHQRLSQHGLRPRRKFLLIGPPGTGKTMTASAVAGELGLPLFTVLLDGLITKFMGETAAKLRLVFDAMRETRGVYFFDEFDALASSRTLLNDVGEARRMLNSILQFLDEDTSNAVIIAATNHKNLLDRAVFRRFDTAIEYAILTEDLVRQVFQKALFLFDVNEVDWSVVAPAAVGMSQADLVRASEDAARSTVLGNKDRIDTTALMDAITDCRAFSHRD
jgi:SpoVK/Ycf46/Vps4 family AAA+-type ATPase